MKCFKKRYAVEFMDDDRIGKIKGLDADGLVKIFFTTPESLFTIVEYIKDAEESVNHEYEAYPDLDAYIPEVSLIEYRHEYEGFSADTAPELTRVRVLITAKDKPTD